MIKSKIKFIQYYAYESEGETEEECFEKAREAFEQDMRSPVPCIWYDDVEEEYEYEDDED